MFSGVLQFTLSRRSVIIDSMVIRLVSLWFCFSSFVLVSVLVLLLCVRMLNILFGFLFVFSFFACLRTVELLFLMFGYFLCFVVLFCLLMFAIVLNFVALIGVLSFRYLLSSCLCERYPLLCLGLRL